MGYTAIQPNMITREALRLLVNLLADPYSANTTAGQNTIWTIDVSFDDRELLLPLDDFSNRIIEPAMTLVAREILHSIKSKPHTVFSEYLPEIPRNRFTSVEGYNNVCLRIHMLLDPSVGEKKIYQFSVVLCGPIHKRKPTIEDRLEHLEGITVNFYEEWKSAHNQANE